MTPTETPIEAPADVPVHCARLREALRSAASALRETGPRFALAGSYDGTNQWLRSLATNLSFVRLEYPEMPSSLARFFSCGTVQSW
jgi:hypothetical protein